MMIEENEGLHRAQRAFRAVLDAFARPGTVRAIERAPQDPARPVALDPALEQAVRLFVDQAVTFAVADAEPDAIAAYLTGETHARRAPVGEAAFVVAPQRADVRTVQQAVIEASAGTLLSPERGATVIVGCACVAPAAAASAGGEPALHVIELRGPGIKDVNAFAVDRIDWAQARTERADEYPCGLEFLLVDPNGTIVAIPRTSTLTLREESAPCHPERAKRAEGSLRLSSASPAPAASAAESEAI